LRFLIDAQLPPALARYLSSLGHHAEHVVDLGLESASDRTIWMETQMRSAILISKDEDFVYLASRTKSGPQLIWLRLGNTSSIALIDRLKRSLPEILDGLRDGERVIEVV
jgi:predicted nuclease of predicted toxin-antitoxin system